MQAGIYLSQGLLRFYSKGEIRRFLKELNEFYLSKAAQYGDSLGGLLRDNEKQKIANDKGQERQKGQSKGWVRMGPLLINVSDPIGGMIEIMFQLHEEYKQKAERTSEALKAFDELSNTIIPEAGAYMLHLKNGLPERILVDSREKKRESFSYNASFKLV